MGCLGHHAAKGEELEVAEGDADNELVQHGRQEEDDERRRLPPRRHASVATHGRARLPHAHCTRAVTLGVQLGVQWAWGSRQSVGAMRPRVGGGARRRFELGGVRIHNIENNVLLSLKSAIGVLASMHSIIMMH